MVSKYRPKNSADGVVVDPDVPTFTELITQWAKNEAPNVYHHDEGALNQNRFSVLTGITTTVINRWFLRGSVVKDKYIRPVHEATGIPMAKLEASAAKTQALWKLSNSTGEILNNAHHILELAQRVEKVEGSTATNTAAIVALTEQVEALVQSFASDLVDGTERLIEQVRGILDGGPAVRKRK